MTTQSWVYNMERFYEFPGFVTQIAPDFPEEDFLERDEQLNIPKGFQELHNGIVII
jgi:hypothetical protein